MKRIITILVSCIFIATGAFAQKKCAYLTKPLPVANGDTVIINYLNNNGYTVTPVLSTTATPDLSTYDVVFISEYAGSGDAAFASLRTAPKPIVSSKYYAIKNTALAWISTATAGTDYANSNTQITGVVETSHPIVAGLTSPITVSTGVGVVPGWGYSNIPATTGLTVVATLGDSLTRQSIAAIEIGTVLNSNTLLNRVALVNIGQGAYNTLTADAKLIIKQACDWVSGTADNKDAISSNLLKKVDDELVNPTNLEVEIYSVTGVKVLTSKESSIGISGLANGGYVAKTAQGTLKFIK